MLLTSDVKENLTGTIQTMFLSQMANEFPFRRNVAQQTLAMTSVLVLWFLLLSYLCEHLITMEPFEDGPPPAGRKAS